MLAPINSEFFCNGFGFKKEQIIAIFAYGSRVYGTHHDKSDQDFIIVLNKADVDSDRLDLVGTNISITIYLEETFKAKIAEHKIFALECIFCPSEFVIKNDLKIDFKLNKAKLRESISEKCSKDWNQAKKRFSDSQGINPITKEPYIRKVYEGKKSLFHCFRMIDFAIQIINKGKIENFASCNELWEEIYTDPSEDWAHYDNKYRKMFNEKMTEFRKLAPK